MERILEVAAATCPSTSSTAETRPKRLLDEASSSAFGVEGLPEISRGGVLKSSVNTRMIVACLLARLFNDLRSDQNRQRFSQSCCDFVM